tara:strand:- start:9144 stop:9884 length:741 start_codon:yes stop_codon:yes gene_type:complete
MIKSITPEENKSTPAKEIIYYQYSQWCRKLFSYISLTVRKEMLNTFHTATNFTSEDTILDVGVTADQENSESNFFEKYYPFQNNITAVGTSSATYLEEEYPGLKFVLADGKNLPFPSDSFDYVFSNAVIEHVGSSSEQSKFIKELNRVAKKGVFITTPNRWFPVEFHVILPFVHWLPKPWFRFLMRLIKREPFHQEEYLNLLSFRDLKKMCTDLGIKNYSFYKQRVLGITSNINLYTRKIDHSTYQ